MGREIERKFLVVNDTWKANATSSTPFRQGYLSRDPLREVRVRTEGDEAVMTVKGKTSDPKVRSEFQYPVPLDDARSMLQNQCLPGIIEKTRYTVPHEQGLTFEIDVYGGKNAGLVVAEVELSHEGQEFTRPAWLGEEVTSDKRYKNAALSETPYTTWGKTGTAAEFAKG